MVVGAGGASDVAGAPAGAIEVAMAVVPVVMVVGAGGACDAAGALAIAGVVVAVVTMQESAKEERARMPFSVAFFHAGRNADTQAV
mmetsp:Transcript_67317/g.146708  ORF Transcript_67317/g.146708 Transcript_67317/m.146708 type:complete len:86 (-) Transcript_67317:394-651(-)